MSKSILIMGESGSGKTTSMRNLNPAETFYIDCDKKGLSWKGWKKQYNAENKNYMATSDVPTIMSLLSKISNEQPQFKVVVIDTLNAIMIDDEFNRMREKGYDKWQELAYSIYGIIQMSNILRQDLTVILVMHSITERDEVTGTPWTHARTSGKKLEKVVVESKLTTVLLAKCIDGKYYFETKSNNSTVKAPIGAFEQDKIENDIVKVVEALSEY